jgi:hypothetical protein
MIEASHAGAGHRMRAARRLTLMREICDFRPRIGYTTIKRQSGAASAMKIASILSTALALVAIALMPAHGATFSVKRGLNLDIWETWPDPKDWSKEGVLLPFPEWRKSLGLDGLRALKADGFDFLRMPVDPSPFLSEQAAALRPRLVQAVLASARMINAAGLKVIVDMHLIPSGDNRSVGMGQVMDDAAQFDRYVQLVREMAGALAREDPEQVAFEPMNEPVIDCDANGKASWPERQKRLFAAARASATRLTLILTGACYSSAAKLAEVDPGDYPDDNVIWTFHSYDPFLLTQQGALWAGDFIRYVTGLPYPPYAAPPGKLAAALDTIRARIKAEAPLTRRSAMLAYLDEQFATLDTKEKLDAVMGAPFKAVASWAGKHEIPPHDILLGEFGMIRQEYDNPHVVPAADRAAYMKDMIGRAEKHGFAWAIWDYGGAFGVVEAFAGRKAEPETLDMVRSLPALSGGSGSD